MEFNVVKKVKINFTVVTTTKSLTIYNICHIGRSSVIILNNYEFTLLVLAIEFGWGYLTGGLITKQIKNSI